ncbi:MAG: DivIVA domain-containing protein [Bacillota bacterium]
MALTPLDITNKEFKKKLLGGYDPDQVDEFLDQIIREFEVLIKENTTAKEQVELLNQRVEQYRALEETINKTLVIAQESAEEIKANARREADLIIQEARLQAERILEAGQAKARRIMEENADLARAAHTLRGQVRALLQAQLEAIDTIRDPFAQAAVARQPEPAQPARVTPLPRESDVEDEDDN